MQADRVVPALDIAEAGYSGLRLGSEPPPLQQFGFERREEALGHGVVIGIAHRAHRWSHAGLAATLAEGQGRVLCGFKRSSQHCLLAYDIFLYKSPVTSRLIKS